MNLVLAFVLMALVLYQGIEMPAFMDQPVEVGALLPGSPAVDADVRPGDRILSVAGHRVNTWEQFLLAINTRPNREVALVIDRGGESITRSVTPRVDKSQSRFEIGEIGVLPNTHPHVGTVQSGGAAEKAGILPNDEVVAVNGETIAVGVQLKEAISKHPDQTITLSLRRNNAPLTMQATPINNGGQGLLGISIGEATKSIKPTVLGAMKMSVEKNIEYGGLIFQTVWGLITRETSPKQLMGPVAIAQMSGESAQLGWVALFSLMASLSLNLGILNLLPIPVLDGGHIFIMGLEGLARRDFSVKVKEKMLLAGFVALMVLMSAVIYNDLTRISWISRLMPWR
jgi:regulator of sigma E protease